MTKQSHPTDDTKQGWFTTKVKALTAGLIAVGALIAAGKPIVEVFDSLACDTWQLCGHSERHSDQPLDPPPSGATIATGATGWIYAGARVGDAWQTTTAEGAEPALTIDSSGLPVTGNVYRLTRPVFLRANAPVEQVDGSRPVMLDSKGGLQVGRSVKVDKVQSIIVKDPVPHTWIWAHVTVVD